MPAKFPRPIQPPRSDATTSVSYHPTVGFISAGEYDSDGPLTMIAGFLPADMESTSRRGKWPKGRLKFPCPSGPGACDPWQGGPCDGRLQGLQDAVTAYWVADAAMIGCNGGVLACAGVTLYLLYTFASN